MLARAITLLEQISAAGGPVGVSALARKTAIPKTTAYRLLENLAHQDLLARRTGGYVIGPRMRSLVRLIHDRLSDDLRDLLRPYLVELHVRTGEVVTLGILDDAEMVILETIRGLRHAGMAAPADRTPAHCSAIGKLLMAKRADLPALRAAGVELTPCTTHTITDWTRLAAEFGRIRRHGVAVSHQEHILGVIDVAMPIVGRSGPIAGVALSRPIDVVTTHETHTTHREIVLAASAAIHTLRPPSRSGRRGRPSPGQ
jgi:DNA-binding IclR family transcriptional regulator